MTRRPAARADNLRPALARKLNSTWRPVAVVGAIAAMALAGCGGKDAPDLANGKKLFIGKGTCGSCHTAYRVQLPDKTYEIKTP